MKQMDLVREYLKLFSTSAKKTIARKLVHDHPLLFKDVEHARSLIRRLTCANKKYPIPIEHNSIHTAKNPYGLPTSDIEPFTPFTLPKSDNNILFLSDIHLPYHDITALTIALDYGKKEQINTIYLNGDIMDMYKGSFHEQDPNKRDLAYEFEICRDFLSVIKKEFPNAKIYYKEGNHEMRWDRYLRVKAPIIFNMAEFRLPILLKLEENGITWIPNKQLVKMGKLNAIHGNEYKGGGGINVARTLWLRAGDNVIAGDKHKTQTGLKTNIDKSVVGTFAVGCLCELNPDYLPFNEWNLGFAIVKIEDNGDFSVQNKQIINGKAM